jgi:hypothetical protein
LSSPRLRPIGAPGDLISGVEFGEKSARQRGHKFHNRGGVVESVGPGSPADRAGLHAGDTILSINGSKIRDVIDYQFFCADAEVLRFEVVSPEQPDRSRVRVAFPRAGESAGISFTEPTFSPIRECNNHCPFCFIDQLPGSMRNSLYIRDDDYRYSFLFGNFVTLTNLNESDWKRLEEQRLSPLYVSVHATEPEMRRVLLGNEKIPDIMLQLERLFSLGIRVHTQVVACPGMNDGSVLEHTVRDLAAFYPQVLSIGIVPVGLTYSRTGAVGLLAVCAALAIGIRARPRAHVLAIALLLAGAGIPALTTLSGWTARAETLEVASASLSERGIFAAQGLALLAGAPVTGIGPGRSVIALREAAAARPGSIVLAEPVHNVPLLAAVEGGPLAGILATALLGCIAWRARARPAAIAVLVGFLPFVLLDHYPYTYAQGLVLFGIWLGSLSAPVGDEVAASAA